MGWGWRLRLERIRLVDHIRHLPAWREEVLTVLLRKVFALWLGLLLSDARLADD